MTESVTQMRAAMLHAPGDLRLEEVALPQAGPDDVLVRIATNGLCGSDIHFYKEGRLGPFVVDRPYIPGHECCGVVVKAAAAGGPQVGTRVALEPGIPCRRCRLCTSGRYNLCRDVVFLSAPPVNGTFAEYAAVPADLAHVLPSTVDDESGAFVEPLAVAVQACTRGGLTAASTVAVIVAAPSVSSRCWWLGRSVRRGWSSSTDWPVVSPWRPTSGPTPPSTSAPRIPRRPCRN